jgi:hypothetical protein
MIMASLPDINCSEKPEQCFSKIIYSDALSYEDSARAKQTTLYTYKPFTS